MPSARHSIARTPYQPGVELVDHDVGFAVERERLVVAEPLDDPQVDVEGGAGRDDVLRPLPPPRRRGVDDDGPLPVARRDRRDRREVDPGRDHRRLRNPADRVPAADDLARPPSCRPRAAPGSFRGCPTRGTASPSASGRPGGSGTGAIAGRASARRRSGRRPCGAGVTQARATARPGAGRSRCRARGSGRPPGGGRSG